MKIGGRVYCDKDNMILQWDRNRSNGQKLQIEFNAGKYEVMALQ